VQSSDIGNTATQHWTLVQGIAQNVPGSLHCCQLPSQHTGVPTLYAAHAKRCFLSRQEATLATGEASETKHSLTSLALKTCSVALCMQEVAAERTPPVFIISPAKGKKDNALKIQTPPLCPGPHQFQPLGCLTYSGAPTRRVLMEAGN